MREAVRLPAFPSGDIDLARFGLVGTGHHSFFRDAQGKWKIAFHAHNTHDKIHPRLMHIADVEFVEADGTVVPDIGSRTP